jgi:hypothetical protein
MAERGVTRRSLLRSVGAAASGLALPRAAQAHAEPAGAGRRALDPPDLATLRAASTAADAAALATIAPTLPAGPGQPAIVAREAWAQGGCPPRVAPAYGEVGLAFVHHTENPNGYQPADVPAMLRSIYAFHRYGRGWNDIGYNFVIDRFGRIFEARAGGIDEPVVGAQAGGYNIHSTGVAVLGEYGAVRISAAARMAHLLAWKLSLHGVPVVGDVQVRVDPAGAVYSRFPANARVQLPRVAGHRDADSTTCPGDALYGELPGVRAAAAALAERPARLTLELRLDETSGAPAALAGALALLGEGAGTGGAGASILGAPVQIQARSVARHGELVRERVVAQAQTAPDGSFSVPLTPTLGAPAVWVRALCPGAAGIPATISPAVQLSAAVPSTTAPSTPPSGPSPPPGPQPASPPAG